MADTINIAFIGLGVMGGPMAVHLARAGYSVTAYNRSPKRADHWREQWASEGLDIAFADTPAAAAAEAQAVMVCVGRDDDLLSVTLSDDGILASLAKGAILIDHTSVSAGCARQVAEHCAQKSIDFVDAPVSGGEAGAQNGQLAIMCGGSETAMTRARPLMQPYAKTITHVGEAGAGQTAKLANQMCIAGTLAGLGEALRLAQAAGLDTDRTFEAICGGAAQSWQMDNRWASMARDEFDFGFAIDWMRKDLANALAEAQRLGLSSPVTALVDQFYADVQAMGAGRMDTSALVKRLPDKS